MEMIPIGKAAELFGVSTRTLRYYEQQGLLQSRHKPDSTYRFYAPEDLERLQSILILRRLRVPLEDIRRMLANANNNEVFRTLRAQLSGLGAEMERLAGVRATLEALLQTLQQHTGSAVYHLPKVEEEVLRLVQALPVEPMLAPFTQPTMPDVRPGDIRVVSLPPATVASVHRVGGGIPEEETRALLCRFIHDANLFETWPGFRCFGFNHPNGIQPDGSDHGYERWVTIPPALDVPAGFEKKQFPGGRYAARAIAFGHFEEWDTLNQWVLANPELAPNLGPEEIMNGLMEEELDAGHLYHLPVEAQADAMLLDLLLPIKDKSE